MPKYLLKLLINEHYTNKSIQTNSWNISLEKNAQISLKVIHQKNISIQINSWNKSLVSLEKNAQISLKVTHQMNIIQTNLFKSIHGTNH